MQWLYLGLATVCEVIATSAPKSSNSFSRLLPSGIGPTVAGMLALTLMQTTTVPA